MLQLPGLIIADSIDGLVMHGFVGIFHCTVVLHVSEQLAAVTLVVPLTKAAMLLVGEGFGQGIGNAEEYFVYLQFEFQFINIGQLDRKSTRLNSSHVRISYAVFCLKKKKSVDRNALFGAEDLVGFDEALPLVSGGATVDLLVDPDAHADRERGSKLFARKLLIVHRR